jgi:hypothetical protein
MNTLAAPILYRRCYRQDIVAFAYGVHSARNNPQACDKKTCLRFIRDLHLTSAPYLRFFDSTRSGDAGTAADELVYESIDAATGAIYDIMRSGCTVKDRLTLDAFEPYTYVPQAGRQQNHGLRLLLAFDDIIRRA